VARAPFTEVERAPLNVRIPVGEARPPRYFTEVETAPPLVRIPVGKARAPRYFTEMEREAPPLVRIPVGEARAPRSFTEVERAPPILRIPVGGHRLVFIQEGGTRRDRSQSRGPPRPPPLGGAQASPARDRFLV